MEEWEREGEREGEWSGWSRELCMRCACRSLSPVGEGAVRKLLLFLSTTAQEAYHEQSLLSSESEM